MLLPWSDIWWLCGGLGISLLLLVCGLVVSLAGGLLVALGQLSRAPWLRRPAVLYVELVRGLPLLFVIYFLYVGLTDVVTLDDIPAAILAFGITYSAFIGEVYRAGIQAVDPGQTEAARALGLSARQTMRHVVLPQAIRNILPALGNESIALWKDTALASAIGVEELLRRARLIGGANFNFFQALAHIGVMYLIVTLLMTRGQKWLDRRYGSGGAPAPAH